MAPTSHALPSETRNFLEDSAAIDKLESPAGTLANSTEAIFKVKVSEGGRNRGWWKESLCMPDIQTSFWLFSAMPHISEGGRHVPG